MGMIMIHEYNEQEENVLFIMITMINKDNSYFYDDDDDDSSFDLIHSENATWTL